MRNAVNLNTERIVLTTEFPHILLRYICIFLLLHLVIGSSLAQEIKYKHYTTDDGLSHNIGFDIHQSKDGRIWIGTDEGISIYDGQTFTNLTQEDGLLGSSIITLSENPYTDEIYASVYKVGVNVINTEGKISQLSEPDKLIIPNLFYYPVFAYPEISSTAKKSFIFHDPDHYEYLLTITDQEADSFQMQRLLLSKQNGILRIEKLDESKSVRNIMEDRIEELRGLKIQVWLSKLNHTYLATSLGFWKLNENKQIIQPYEALPESDFYRVIDEDREGNLWVAGNKQLYRIEEQSGQVRTYTFPDPEMKVIQMRIISEREIYLVDETRVKLILWDPIDETWSNLYETIGINAGISFIEKDIENNIWVTTDGDGIYNIYNHNFSNQVLSDSYKQNFISDLKVDEGGNVWAATKEGLFKNQKGEWIFYGGPKDKDKEIVKLHYKKGDGLYAAYRKRLEKVIGPNFFQSCFIRFPTYLTISASGKFVLITDNNLSPGYNPYFYFHDNCMQVPTDSILVPAVLAGHGFRSRNFIYHEKQDGTIWTAYNRKILHIEGDSSTAFGKEEGLPSDLINDLTEDAEGNIWLATEYGVAKYIGQEDQAFQTFDILPKLPIRQILFDKKGNLWMGSPRGLFVWDRERVIHFNAQSGLITNDVTSICIDHEDHLWVGTSAGLSILDLKKPLLRTKLPPLFFDKILINGESANPKSINEITQQSLVEVSYRSITYIANNVLRYEYRFNNQSEWQKTDQPNFSFSNLETGAYNLQIRAKSPISDWSEPIQWNFYIVPPWYRSVLALFLWGLLLAFLISAFIYFRIRAVKKAEEEKTRINKRIAEIELKTLQAQINPHFIFNALNAIQSYSLEHDTISTNTYLTRFARLMRLFLEASKKNRIRLTDEMEMLKLYIEMEQICNEGKFEYELQADSALDLEETYVPSMLIQPFVENSIRHGLFHKIDKGMLKVQFREKGEQLLCTIDDDGVGRVASQTIKENSFKDHVSRGMQIVNERLEMQNFVEGSKIKIDVYDKYGPDQSPQGTLISIWVPL